VTSAPGDAGPSIRESAHPAAGGGHEQEQRLGGRPRRC
jgi:hypothetical protein